MGSSSSKPRGSVITADTSVAEAQLLLQQAIASTLEATEAATQAAAAARTAQLAAEEAVGTATTALVTLAAVSGKDPCRLEVDAWISPPARVARPRSTTPVVDKVAIVAARDVAAGSGTSRRGHAAEGSGVGLAVGLGLAAPVAEQGPAGAAAGAAAGAPTAAQEQALAGLSDAWNGVRPAYLPVPLPADVETVPPGLHVLTPPHPALNPTLNPTLTLALALALALSLALSLALAPALPFALPFTLGLTPTPTLTLAGAALQHC